MQTIYYETSNFIRHEGNLVDLAAYRQKLAAVSGGNWSPAPEGSSAFEAEAPPHTGTVLRLVPEESPAQRRARRTGRRLRRAALALDFCASAAIVVLTVSAVIGFLHL